MSTGLLKRGHGLARRLSSVARVPFRPYELNVRDEEWDTVAVLDGCRYDAYQEVIGDSVDWRISQGSASGEFLRKNFQGKTFHDTVYVTANPWALTEVPDDVFFKVFHVWDTHWNEELGTVLPEDLVAVAEEAFEAHPNKKFIVHFMQPHLGRGGAALDTRTFLAPPPSQRTALTNTPKRGGGVGLTGEYPGLVAVIPSHS